MQLPIARKKRKMDGRLPNAGHTENSQSDETTGRPCVKKRFLKRADKARLKSQEALGKLHLEDEDDLVYLEVPAEDGGFVPREHEATETDDVTPDFADSIVGHSAQASTLKRKRQEEIPSTPAMAGLSPVVKPETAKGSSFQSMGLMPSLLRSILLKGFKTPTPIQRQTIPLILDGSNSDIVGMARTGSGKTLAYLIPLIQRLGGAHTYKVGLRSLVLVPARELALQILKVGKDLCRNVKPTGGEGKDHEPLRWGLVVGGESLDEQFRMVSSNPDIIIATPGRLLHLLVEMKMDLKTVEYVVFDECDRLFEMGFAVQLHEILHKLPLSRQTLLFSATLPKTLVEFAKAGLQDPTLVRLDSETKISKDLEMAFISVKQAEKEAALLYLLREVLRIPLLQSTSTPLPDTVIKDRNRSRPPHSHKASSQQALIFAATRHHVEYVAQLLKKIGYRTSYIYGSLDQEARREQMESFRSGESSLLVVTDVAARGIDIPVLENVVNYDFPSGGRVFVHRVGRTARAGSRGWAYSLLTNPELPFLMDLQLFLGRPLKTQPFGRDEAPSYNENIVLGSLPASLLEDDIDSVNTILTHDAGMDLLKGTVARGQKKYEQSRVKASAESYRRAKLLTQSGRGIAGGSSEEANVHPLLKERGLVDSQSGRVQDRNNLLHAIDTFRPTETVLEIGSRGSTAPSRVMRDHRRVMARKPLKSYQDRSAEAFSSFNDREVGGDVAERLEAAAPAEIDEAFHPASGKTRPITHDAPHTTADAHRYRDKEFYMSHYRSNADDDRGYSLTDGVPMGFVEMAQQSAMDLQDDEGQRIGGSERKTTSGLRWDPKKKKFLQGSGEGSDNKKMIRTESGVRLPASFRSGRYDEWRQANRVASHNLDEEAGRVPASTGHRYRHTGTKAAKPPLDPMHINYEKQKRRLDAKAKEADDGARDTRPAKGQASTGGLKSANEILKKRKIDEQRRAKNARHGKPDGRPAKKALPPPRSKSKTKSGTKTKLKIKPKSKFKPQSKKRAKR